MQQPCAIARIQHFPLSFPKRHGCAQNPMHDKIKFPARNPWVPLMLVCCPERLFENLKPPILSSLVRHSLPNYSLVDIMGPSMCWTWCWTGTSFLAGVAVSVRLRLCSVVELVVDGCGIQSDMEGPSISESHCSCAVKVPARSLLCSWARCCCARCCCARCCCARCCCARWAAVSLRRACLFRQKGSSSWLTDMAPLWRLIGDGGSSSSLYSSSSPSTALSSSESDSGDAVRDDRFEMEVICVVMKDVSIGFTNWGPRHSMLSSKEPM
ncbi:hypothetical protein FJTKL_02504 [Diaporthe vaccinii]|uniref:Uncharacterized protein n=1 Tax=Diaporthe vaccinii TaxID=105482 RepID=A0ABR4DYC8_9PEZI